MFDYILLLVSKQRSKCKVIGNNLGTIYGAVAINPIGTKLVCDLDFI